jgi:hypothetical protein
MKFIIESRLVIVFDVSAGDMIRVNHARQSRKQDGRQKIKAM